MHCYMKILSLVIVLALKATQYKINKYGQIKNVKLLHTRYNQARCLKGVEAKSDLFQICLVRI